MPTTRPPTRLHVWPTTRRGWWVMGAFAVFMAGVALFAVMVSTGERGGDAFFDNLLLALPGLAAAAAATVTLGLGIVAMVRDHERSLATLIAVALAAPVVLMVIAEIAFPH
jgi:bacteriorhodopsin